MSASDIEEHKRLKGLLEYHQMIVHEWLKEGDRPYLCFGAYSVEELTGLRDHVEVVMINNVPATFQLQMQEVLHDRHIFLLNE
jgi:hypothetical protein